MHTPNRQRVSHGLQPVDRPLLAAIGALVLFGLFALASASSVYSYQRYGHTYAVIFHQLVYGVLPGLVLFAIFLKTDYQVWLRYRWWFFAATLGLLISVYVPGLGQVRNGARSWIGIGGVVFQPAEVVKLTALLFSAAWFSRLGFQRVRRFYAGLAPFGLFLAAIAWLIIRQPDLGTLLVISVILAAMFFTAGARVVHWLIVAGTGGLLMLAVLLNDPRRINRLWVFLSPGLDPGGTGYHAQQALLAIGAGGWFGRGFGKSIQKFAYLPEVSADSIFAIVAEELGFLAAAGLVALVTFVVLRGLRVARGATDPFGRFLAVGVAVWFGFQSILNIAVMIGLAPLTGLPLPFVSAGGTAMAANLAAAGLLLNVSRHAQSS